MVITFKLVKIVMKFIMCSIVLLLIYNFQNTTQLKNDNKKPISMDDPENLKYILVWNRDSEYNFLRKGQEIFRKKQCQYSNCFVSRHRNMLHKDYRNYHAILFSGKTMVNKFVDGYLKLPKKRERHQTYIFGMQGDAIRNPVCDEKFDNYFNLTWTYKLDSDVIWPFFTVIERETAKVVSPSINVSWKKSKESDMMFEIQEHLLNKRDYGVWVSSVCKTPSQREEVVNKIKDESQANGYNLDVIGDCGSQKCNQANNGCLKLLDTYSFYLAFESVLAEDYVTGDIVNAIRRLCLPVVYGGANYSRFLPPNSFIDATKLGPKETVKLMEHLMKDIAAYFSYFNWRMTYGIKKDHGESACDLCEALNRNGEKVHVHFRKWWNPDYEKACNVKQRRTRYYRLNYHNGNQPPRMKNDHIHIGI